MLFLSRIITKESYKTLVTYIVAKAELKYYSELRKAYQKALNHKGGMVDLRILDYQYFADRLEQNENGIFYKHAGGQLEQVFVFNDGQMLDETMLNEMYQALYIERVNTQIKQEQQKAQTLIELVRINNAYRILDIEKDIVFGKFDIEQNKIVSLDEYNARKENVKEEQQIEKERLERVKELNEAREAQAKEQGTIVRTAFDEYFNENNIDPNTYEPTYENAPDAVKKIADNAFEFAKENRQQFIDILEELHIATGAIEYVKETTNSKGVKVDTLQKGKNSIVDKLYRKNTIGENKNYGIYNFNDLLRSAILFNPVDTHVEIDVNAIHKTVQHLIQKYKKNSTTAIRDITVELKNNIETGYKGIHITMLMDTGITSEIILATPEHWRIKGEQEAIYQKTRSYKDKNSPSVQEQLAKSIEIGKDYMFSTDLLDLLDNFSIQNATTFSLTELISVSNTKSTNRADDGTKTPLSSRTNTDDGSVISKIAGVPVYEPSIKNFLDIITSPLSEDSLQQNKNDVNPSNRYSFNKDIAKTNEMKYTELVGKPISAETSQLANVEYEREHLKIKQWIDNNKTQIDSIKKANEPYYNRIKSGEIIDVNELSNLEAVIQAEKLVHLLGEI